MGVVERIWGGRHAVQCRAKVNIVHGFAGNQFPGTFAEKLVADVDTLGAIPAGWTDEQAARRAAGLRDGVSGDLRSGTMCPPQSVVLITGASGGVGSACVQLAKAMGHTVIGAVARCGEIEKAPRDRRGHDVRSERPELEEVAKEQLGKRRVNLAIDNVGGKPFNDVLDMMAMNGRITVVGRLAGPVPEFNTATLFFRRLRIGGIAIHTYEPTKTRHAWEEVQRSAEQTGARPLIDSIHPFEQVA